MNKDLRKYLFDTQESVNSIFKYLEEQRDFKVYQEDKLLRRTVGRKFEIIGEASNRILNQTLICHCKTPGVLLI